MRPVPWLALFLPCAMLAPASVQAACSYDPFRFTFGSVNASTTLRIHPGETCAINLQAHNGTIFQGLRTVSAPLQGTVGRSGVDSFAYRAHPSASGRDYFVVEVRGKGRPSGAAQISVNVEFIADTAPAVPPLGGSQSGPRAPRTDSAPGRKGSAPGLH